MKKLARLQKEVSAWRSLQTRLREARELSELDDDSIRADLETEIADLEKETDQRELKAMLAGDYDSGDALLSINAGAGGTDSQDWSAMLLRMYLRWAEDSGYKVDVLDQTAGEEAGIKSVTLAISGEYAYGYLKSEKGVHRLVRISPFDSNARRHTSFTQVEILPQVESDEEIELNMNDVKIESFRAGGAGGQNVQKNDTAIRVTHIPTGLVASCQNERSQTQNRENALRVLKARLLELKREQEEAEIAKLKGQLMKNEWGSQIRSYVLHPYQMVKDHRTEHEVGNAAGVLDGDLDGFIQAYLRMNVGKSTGAS